MANQLQEGHQLSYKSKATQIWFHTKLTHNDNNPKNDQTSVNILT